MIRSTNHTLPRSNPFRTVYLTRDLRYRVARNDRGRAGGWCIDANDCGIWIAEPWVADQGSPPRVPHTAGSGRGSAQPHEVTGAG